MSGSSESWWDMNDFPHVFDSSRDLWRFWSGKWWSTKCWGTHVSGQIHRLEEQNMRVYDCVKHVFYWYSFVRRTVTTLVWTAPRNQWSICSKCTWSRMNLLCFPDLILDWRAVTSRKKLAPCNQRSIAANCSKCGSRGLNTFHISKLILD